MTCVVSFGSKYTTTQSMRSSGKRNQEVATFLENRPDRKSQSRMEGFVSGDSEVVPFRHSGMRPLAQARNPEARHCLWIPGSPRRATLCADPPARPGMTRHTIHLVIPGCAAWRRPGIQRPGLDSGFAPSAALCADPPARLGMTNTRPPRLSAAAPPRLSLRR
jgi:hypothetical protein